jgi:hypothetical protein
MHLSRRMAWILFLLPLLLGAAWLTRSTTACAATAPGNAAPAATPAATPQPVASPANVASAAADSMLAIVADPGAGLSTCPVKPANAFGDPVFWMVMGLVLLGYFVLAADIPQHS